MQLKYLPDVLTHRLPENADERTVAGSKAQGQKRDRKPHHNYPPEYEHGKISAGRDRVSYTDEGHSGDEALQVASIVGSKDRSSVQQKRVVTFPETMDPALANAAPSIPEMDSSAIPMGTLARTELSVASRVSRW